MRKEQQKRALRDATMLRDNLAGLIEPMVACAGADPLAGHHKAGQTGDAPGPPRWQSSLWSDPGATFFAGKRSDRQKKQNGPVLQWPLRLRILVRLVSHGTRVIGR